MRIKKQTPQYNPGPPSSDNWLALHRNENLFISRSWLSQIISEEIKNIRIGCYPDHSQIELRKKIGKKYNLNEDWIYVSNGADGVLADLFVFFRSKYKTLSLQKTGYAIYQMLGKRLHYEINTLTNQGFDHQLVVIDSPNALTGEVVSKEQLLHYASNHNFLIWDNVYGEFSKDRIIASEIEQNNLIIVRSFSKYYGLAGLRLGYCIAHPDLISQLLFIKDIFNVNAFTQAIGCRVLDEEQIFQTGLNEMEKAKMSLSQFLTQFAFKISNSKTNFLLVSHAEHQAEEIKETLEKDLIAVRHFQQPEVKNCLRITVPPREKLLFLQNSLKNLFVSSYS